MLLLYVCVYVWLTVCRWFTGSSSHPPPNLPPRLQRAHQHSSTFQPRFHAVAQGQPPHSTPPPPPPCPLGSEDPHTNSTTTSTGGLVGLDSSSSSSPSSLSGDQRGEEEEEEEALGREWGLPPTTLETGSTLNTHSPVRLLACNCIY